MEVTELYSRKYAPQSFDDFMFNKDLAEKLKAMVLNKDEMPNIIFHGRRGCGKRTISYALIREMFGDSIYSLNINTMTLESNKKITYHSKSSKHHIEICLSDYDINDRSIITEYIDTLTSTQNICSNSYKVIIITHADKLSFQAQDLLRRICENRLKMVRFIFTATTLTKINPTLRSRCCIFRVPIPSKEDLYSYIKTFDETGFSRHAFNKLLKSASPENDSVNVKSMLNIYQASLIGGGKYKQYEFKYRPILDGIVEQIKAGDLENIRETLYDCYVNHLNTNVFFKYIVNSLIKEKLSVELIENIVDIGLKYEYNCQKGNKEMIHMEAFIYNLMKLFEDSDENVTIDYSKKLVRSKKKEKEEPIEFDDD